MISKRTLQVFENSAKIHKMQHINTIFIHIKVNWLFDFFNFDLIFICSYSTWETKAELFLIQEHIWLIFLKKNIS